VCVLDGHVARTKPAGPVPFGRAAIGFAFAINRCNVLTIGPYQPCQAVALSATQVIRMRCRSPCLAPDSWR